MGGARRSEAAEKLCVKPVGVLLGGSPRIYAGEGALQRSGNSSSLDQGALAPGFENPGLKPIFEIERFSAGLKSSFPPAEAGGFHQKPARVFTTPMIRMNS